MREVLFLENLHAYGIIGSHPQFNHCKVAPDGYRFKTFPKLIFRYRFLSMNSKNRKIRKVIIYRVRSICRQMKEIKKYAKQNSFSSLFVYKYFKVLDLVTTQLNIPISNTLVFVPSFPRIIVDTPWVIEIEDIVTLFSPFISNGFQGNIDVRNSEIYRMVKRLLQSDNCKQIITHVLSTKDSIDKIFNDSVISGKVTYIPMGHPSICDKNICRTYQKKLNEKVNILFTSSWHQQGFYNRGGVDAVCAFVELQKVYSNVYLTIKCNIPDDLPDEYKDLIKNNDHIKVIEKKLNDEQMDELMKNTDIIVLPAARIHIVSILSAMGHGIPIVATDGWGISNYIRDRVNGMIVSGRYGKNSFVDETGMLREDYSSMHCKDSFFCSNLVCALSELIRDDALRCSITRQAMEDYYSIFSLEQWNRKLGEVLDRVYERMDNEKIPVDGWEPKITEEDLAEAELNKRYDFTLRNTRLIWEKLLLIRNRNHFLKEMIISFIQKKCKK